MVATVFDPSDVVTTILDTYMATQNIALLPSLTTAQIQVVQTGTPKGDLSTIQLRLEVQKPLLQQVIDRGQFQDYVYFITTNYQIVNGNYEDTHLLDRAIRESVREYNNDNQFNKHFAKMEAGTFGYNYETMKGSFVISVQYMDEEFS